MKTYLDWLSDYELVSKDPVLCNPWFIPWIALSKAAEAWSLSQHPSSTEVKNEWSSTSFTPINLQDVDRKIYFLLNFNLNFCFSEFSLYEFTGCLKKWNTFIANIRADISCWVRMACSDVLFFHKPFSFVSRFTGLNLEHCFVNLHCQPFPSTVA